MITGKNFVEKLYSTNEYYESEKLYSTGDSDLDDLLERAFCEGYEYAQREFGRTGLSKDQAKEWFKGGQGKINKAAKNNLETSIGNTKYRGTVEYLNKANQSPFKDFDTRGVIPRDPAKWVARLNQRVVPFNHKDIDSKITRRKGRKQDYLKKG